MPKRFLFAAVVVVAVAVAAAGCGGSSSSSDTSPAAEWADSLCTSISTWTSSLTSIADSLRGGNLTQDSLTTAVDDAKSATQTFTSSLQDLGKPDTDAGQQAQDTVSQLVTEIQTDMTEIQDTLDAANGVAGVVAAVPTIAGTLSNASQQVSSALTTLKGLDAKGELESAFNDTPSCQSLTGGS